MWSDIGSGDYEGAKCCVSFYSKEMFVCPVCDEFMLNSAFDHDGNSIVYIAVGLTCRVAKEFNFVYVVCTSAVD